MVTQSRNNLAMFIGICGALSVMDALNAAGGSTSAVRAAIRVSDVNGVACAPLANKGQRATVLFFVTNDCPITNAYAPEMERIYKRFTSQGVRFYAVYVDHTVSASDSKKHAAAYGLTFTAVCDVHHDLVKWCKAGVTPEAALVLPHGNVAYRGRIDDRYIDFGKARYHATTHDLTDAISAVLKHRRPANSQVRAIGCYIPPI